MPNAEGRRVTIDPYSWCQAEADGLYVATEVPGREQVIWITIPWEVVKRLLRETEGK